MKSISSKLLLFSKISISVIVLLIITIISYSAGSVLLWLGSLAATALVFFFTDSILGIAPFVFIKGDYIYEIISPFIVRKRRIITPVNLIVNHNSFTMINGDNYEYLIKDKYAILSPLFSVLKKQRVQMMCKKIEEINANNANF